MSTQKTKIIEINTSYLNNSNNKTRKSRGEKRVKTPPLITPNNLKTKLLERIKEHKKKENAVEKFLPVAQNGYQNELSDSMNILSALSKEKKKDGLSPVLSHNKTMKNPYSEKKYISAPHVELELPEELKVSSSLFIPQPSTEKIILKTNEYSIDKELPYGCLKGGVKPTYKVWNTTQKNHIVTNPQEALIIDKTTQINEREERLKKLKEKMKKKQEELKEEIRSDIMMKPLIQHQNTTANTNTTTNTSVGESQQREKKVLDSEPITDTGKKAIVFVDVEEPPVSKQYIKKTIKRKYTLGKSKIHNKIGILIKDKDTRKRVLHAQKELKKKSIYDVKKYLRDHGLMKAGSNAPNDVVRKMYESSMLSGEIVNNNRDILLHNWDTSPEE